MKQGRSKGREEFNRLLIEFLSGVEGAPTR